MVNTFSAVVTRPRACVCAKSVCLSTSPTRGPIVLAFANHMLTIVLVATIALLELHVVHIVGVVHEIRTRPILFLLWNTNIIFNRSDVHMDLTIKMLCPIPEYHVAMKS